tara:strand:+ start:3784 stop:4440 length:657 start_codon:yes stop_codon:yes gene_type:complete
MKTYKASVFGYTGLIGGFLTDILINDPLCDQIITLTRNKVIINNKKHKNHVINFSSLNEIKKIIKNCDYVYSGIGTTQSKVNYNKKIYRSIDYDITLNIARACKECGIKSFSLVSTAGADRFKNNFYLSLKGEIDEEVSKIGIDSLSIFRPSLLLGKRNENRFGEKLAQQIMPLFSSLMPEDYRPIRADFVASSMHKISIKNIKGINIYHYKEIMGNL